MIEDKQFKYIKIIFLLIFKYFNKVKYFPKKVLINLLGYDNFSHIESNPFSKGNSIVFNS